MACGVRAPTAVGGSSNGPIQHPSASDEARIRAAILIEAANALLDAGDHSAAIATYDRATALNPNNAAGYIILRGVAKRDKGDYAGAIADYDRAIALNPNDAGFYRNRGFAKYGIRDYNGAITDYDWYPLNRQDGQSQNPYAIAPTKPQPALTCCYRRVQYPRPSQPRPNSARENLPCRPLPHAPRHSSAPLSSSLSLPPPHPLLPSSWSAALPPRKQAVAALQTGKRKTPNRPRRNRRTTTNGLPQRSLPSAPNTNG